MGTTAHGLPYPEPTDPVAAGAAAIRSLAEAVDAAKPWNTAWGQIAGAVAAADHPGFGSLLSPINGFSITATAVAGRNYRLYVRAAFQAISAVGTVQFKILVNGVDNGFIWAQTGLGINQYASMATFVPIVLGAGSKTIQVAAAIVGGGGMTILSGSVLNGLTILDDVGHT
jgi:hypothetical protein